jgi:hypothetical protein
MDSKLSCLLLQLIDIDEKEYVKFSIQNNDDAKMTACPLV